MAITQSQKKAAGPARKGSTVPAATGKTKPASRPKPKAMPKERKVLTAVKKTKAPSTTKVKLTGHSAVEEALREILGTPDGGPITLLLHAVKRASRPNPKRRTASTTPTKVAEIIAITSSQASGKTPCAKAKAAAAAKSKAAAKTKKPAAVTKKAKVAKKTSKSKKATEAQAPPGFPASAIASHPAYAGLKAELDAASKEDVRCRAEELPTSRNALRAMLTDNAQVQERLMTASHLMGLFVASQEEGRKWVVPKGPLFPNGHEFSGPVDDNGKRTT
ncbi:hypothetical protein LTR53_003247 [Teratosphaeriaceae sp. CCFEE 6253]|nr:hypothetical protein LTR53_003247 [Teratosphaeriaceae sp. CCFEE 6253]